MRFRALIFVAGLGIIFSLSGCLIRETAPVNASLLITTTQEASVKNMFVTVAELESSAGVSPIDTDWPFEKAHYEGVLLKDLVRWMRKTGEGDALVVHCRDGFRAVFPLEFIQKYPAGLVTKVNDKRPHRWKSYKGREMGFYVALPSKSFPELNDSQYGNFWPWQVQGLELVKLSLFLGRADLSSNPRATASIREGQKAFVAQCIHCHEALGQGGDKGPDLSKAVANHAEDSFVKYVKNPKALYPNSQMPGFERVLSDQKLKSIFTYLNALAKP
ncbi:MAG: c-type cytochrome [Elusimicrobia bacterium]|nr:c-type cytochrome [Elusimicrobiota bacterium]